MRTHKNEQSVIGNAVPDILANKVPVDETATSKTNPISRETSKHAKVARHRNRKGKKKIKHSEKTISNKQGIPKVVMTHKGIYNHNMKAKVTQDARINFGQQPVVFHSMHKGFRPFKKMAKFHLHRLTSHLEKTDLYNRHQDYLFGELHKMPLMEEKAVKKQEGWKDVQPSQKTSKSHVNHIAHLRHLARVSHIPSVDSVPKINHIQLLEHVPLSDRIEPMETIEPAEYINTEEDNMNTEKNKRHFVKNTAIGVEKSATGVLFPAEGVLDAALGTIDAAKGATESATGVTDAATGVTKEATGFKP